MQEWIASQERRGYGTGQTEREEAGMSEDEWYVNAVVVTWSRIAGKQYIPLAIKDVILIAIETKEETPVRLSNEEMEVCIAK